MEKFYRIAVTLTLLTALLLAPAIAGATDGVSIIYGPEQISTGGDEETPQIALDSNGNAHIVWAGGDEYEYLFYKMVDADGNVLIDETNLNPCAEPETYHVRRPSIVIDSDNKVHVVFHSFYLYTDFGPDEYGGRTVLAASEVIYLKIDPYLDDMSGDAADFYAITEIPETIISTDDGTKSRAPNMAIDPFDRLHVAWWDGGGGPGGGDDTELHYLVMDLDGGTLVSETTLTTGLYVDIDWGEPEIATDSGGNAHIVYCTNKWDTAREIYYTMMDGDTGNTLIDDTRITSDDGSASVRASLAVDGSDMVHVVWHDKRLYDAGTGEHELFYSKLDPSLDDQSGDAADLDVISLISEQMITSDDGYRSYLTNLAIDPGDRVHVTWVDMYGYDPEEEWGKGEIYYQILDSSGNTIVPETRITYFEGAIDPAYWMDSSGRHPDIAVTSSRVYITFNGHIEEGSSYIYLVILRILSPYQLVGGEILPFNALQLIAPYLIIIVVAVAGTVGILYKKRIP